MDNLKERLAKLTPEQRTQLLSRLNKQKEPNAPQQHRDAVPLSFSQRRLWFLDQFEPGSTNYNILRVYRVRGPLNIDVLRRAVNEIVRRHASLRTRFLLQDDLPVQHIAPSLSLDIPLLHADDDAAVQRLLRAEADTPFDLQQAPLLRAAVIRQGPQLHTLLFNLHHIITDGWSQGIFVRELSQLYAAFAAGQPSPLPELALQYADFAVSQHQQGAALSDQLEHWRRRLASPPVLELPTDRPRPPQMSQRGAVYRYALPPELATRLQQLAVKERATLFMVLMAAFQVLLGRYSGQEDLTVGTPIAGRNRSELEGIIGFFVNTLVMRADLSGDPTFSELLARTRATALDAYTHQDIPFEKLVEELLPERDLSRSPLFQVMFVLQNTPPGALALAGTEVEAIPVEVATAKFDLSLSITESGGALSCLYNYNSDLFDHATIERLAGHYHNLLEDVLAHADRPISRLNLLGPGERQLLLHDWNDTQRDYPAGDTLAGLFEQQAARTPDAPAVIDGGRQASYRELNEGANRLARQLLELGVGRGQAVALYLERGLELITAILAVLKAGGAYLPLDTRHPAQRLHSMLADAGAGTVLGTRATEAKWPCGDEYPLLAIDTPPAAPDTPCTNPGRELRPDDLAYIIYTSGSTGLPKGVMIEHRSVINLARGLHDEIFSAARQGPWRVALNSSITFDASVQQWTRLLFGDALVLIPEDVVPDPAAFGQALTAARVDVLGCTPTQLRQLFASGQFDADHAAPSLVLCGGEAIDADLWRKAAGHARSRFYNVYGPTECTVDATCCRIDTAAGAPHIGRPLPNLQAYILDAHRQPVPVGVAGELYLAGAGVGRGYLHRPELTQERFVTHPFDDGAAARAYRTGDLARFRADGNIEFLGRRDSQVKLRGYRIELGEIESQLKQLPNVRDCVAMLREDRPGDQRIIAYVITDDGDREVLHHQLRQRLPDYMLPGDIVRLDRFPLNASGKIDRQALPRPQRTRAPGKDYTAPRTEQEQALAEIWREVLDVDTLGVHDNFFALGGHSLLAVRVISNINQRLGSRLTLRELFESPTIHALAAILARGHAPARGGDTELTVVRERNELPLSYSQQRLWFLDQFEPGSANYNIPIAYRIRGALDIDALRRAINEIVRRHEGLRTTFALRGDTPVQVISPALDIELPVLQARDEATLQRLILDEANTPFDLQRGPLLRAAVIRHGPREQVLLLNQHHIVSDGWSMGIFTRELARLYQAFSAGQPSPLPEPAFQYADFAVWQQRRQAQLAAQVEYWKQTLAQAPVLELPTDRPRPKVQSYRGAILRRELPTPLAHEIRQLAQRQGVTLFMLLLAAFQALLGRYSGQQDLTVGTPLAGRDRSELENIIGFFINTLVLRADLSGNPSFTELLARTRTAALDAFSHREAPFEKLVEELLPERDMSRNPLFQVMFVLQNTPPAVLTLDGTEVEPIAIPIETEKFDLSLSITEKSGTLSCAYNYNTDLFDGASIERMAQHFHQLLAAVVAEPERPLDGIELLSAEEKQCLLHTWNDTRRDYPLDQTVHALFEAQAARTPQACAVSLGEQRLTYSELNARANRLAHHLIAQRLPREQPVAILMPRCPELIVAVLAVLKAGGAYLPLDIRHPPQRLNTILADAGAGLVLSTRAQAAAWSGGGGHVWLEVDTLTRDAGADAANPGLAIRPRDLAYVIYTSGSTGLPKGVMIEHRSVVNLACAMQDTVFAGSGGAPLRVAMSTALSFDASVDQWIRLLYGDCVALIPEDTVMDTWAFLAALQTQRIEVLSCTPTELRNLLHEGLFDRQPCPSLVLCGGEAMDRDLWRRCAHLPHTRVYNVYGPTECTVDATCASVREVDDAPHIGRPLPNVRAYVLDAQRRPVPVGVAGELYLGGAGVARGYLRRPALDAEAFLADAFTKETGGRLYRTGDMARHRADGRIEYLGRRDAQIKLRGLRIEPGEIEARLKQLPSVRDCVVIAREDEPGDQRLAAYVIATDADLDDLTIKSWLKTGLPDYMVPGDIVRLEQFPLTSGGKLDRKALPAPQRQRGTTDALIAPRTPLEEEIAALWRELLRTDRVGVHDNFFTLGGHSLLGTRLMINLNRRYAARLPLRVLFETPTVEGLAAALQAAGTMDTPHTDGAPGAATGRHATAISPRQAHAPAPLSFAQQRLWFLDQLYPGKADYNLPQLLRLEGPLDVAALRGSLAALLARHDALRTRFIKHHTEARQVVGADDTVVLTVIDLSGARAPEAELERGARAEIARPFDLMQGPLLRATLFRIADRSHALLLVMHHIVSDGWSMEIFNRELGAAYDALLQRRTPAWAPLPIQYADFAVWQRAQDLQGQLDYWKTQLRDAPQVLELPNDKPRPTVQTFDGDQVSVAIPHDLVAALNGLALREHATPFMLLLAVFQLLLHRYSGQRDILVGTPIAGRTQAELEGMIGFFVNSLVLRARLDPAQSFRDFLQQVRATALDAFEHQELPFEKLVEVLAPQRDKSRNPLFQVMFTYQNHPYVVPRMHGLRISAADVSLGKAKFDLTLAILEQDGDVLACFNYNSGLFERASIERMSGHFLSLLQAVAAEPTRSLGQLPLLTVGETAQLARWNDTATEFPRQAGIAVLFEAQAAATPHAIAALHGADSLSYGELNARANRLAHHLLQQGVARGDLIGLCLERGLDTLAAMLAILKCGGAYVPLETAYPKERLALMIEDAGLATVLCHSAQRALLPASVPRLIALDSDRDAIERGSDANPPATADGDSLAYIIYTSGSTGKPKGVCVTQRGVIRLVRNTDYIALDAGDVIAQASNTAFDAATFEIWGALLNGGRVLIVPREILLSQDAFTELLRDQGVTTLFLTTALFNQMISVDSAAFRSLKQLLFGGEACDPKRIRECLAGGPPRRLLHVYGPTETTTFATWYEITQVEPQARTVPIGRPIANTTCQVLDAQRQPVPVGVTGELYIGGAGVARGYLRRPELSAEKFIPDPQDAGGHLYRSGDLVRYRSDGAIEFVGRVDHQIKLRGFRIELGEIDEVLRQHPDVQDAVTLLREDNPGDKRLVGYLSPRPGRAIEDAAVRRYLKQRLPDYMLPAVLVSLDHLPLNANGKVDRAALPAPSNAVAQHGRPRSTLEFHLTKIWEDVLGRAPIGVQDNFFELGGHSLLAVKLMDQIEMHFGKKLPLDTLWFDAATVAEMARILEREHDDVLWPELVPIKGGGEQTPLFVIHTMGGNLFHYYELARHLSPHLPVYGLQARGVYGRQPPRDSVADIAADCIEAMRRRQPHGPYRIAGFSSGGIVAFEMAQQLTRAGETVSRLVLLDCYAPGVKIKGVFWKQVYNLLTLQKLRQFQERFYHGLLHPLGLRRLRAMHSIGEMHRWAHWSYKPQPYRGRIDLFVAAESETSATDPLLGWSRMAAGDLMVHATPGTHGHMVKSPQVEVLAQKLQSILDQDG